ncbi:migration and invasion-inhibitory protein isoform X2 [Hoplias malabaricus]|uniref:migration and invasion-inhibitory protein isoform X2 n=1 Tax=Hoplias malabaricus TaxID=27720 RepID=UPI003462F460
MLSFERLNALRKQNQELLAKLKLQTEKLQSLKLLGPSGVADNVIRTDTETAESSGGNEVTVRVARINEKSGDLYITNVPDPVVTAVPVGKTRALEALCKLSKPRTRTKGEEASEKTDNLAVVSAPHLNEPSQPSEDTTYTSLLHEKGSSRIPEQTPTVGHVKPKPLLHPNDKDQRGLDRVLFQSPCQELEATSERQCAQPLLGYDWIAGLLDAESSLTERSELFFDELRSFRQVNKVECVHSHTAGFPLVTDLWSSSAEEDAADQDHAPDTHQCTFCYRVNSRLFAVPLDSQAACPVCKLPKDKNPHTEKEPAFIRISIPRSTLLPAYRYKAHRCCSFDPSDSLGLPSHCLSGCSNTNMNVGSHMSSLDLRSSVQNRSQSSVKSENQMDLSVSRVSGSKRSEQLLDLSHLARYRFQQLAPSRTKPNKSFYPLY